MGASKWVKQHVALTYAPETNMDGLKAQALRMLSICTLSKALGLKYLHTPPQCIWGYWGPAKLQHS
jgi:hypothetical protein